MTKYIADNKNKDPDQDKNQTNKLVSETLGKFNNIKETGLSGTKLKLSKLLIEDKTSWDQ
jgi:hypothetical protein